MTFAFALHRPSCTFTSAGSQKDLTAKNIEITKETTMKKSLLL